MGEQQLGPSGTRHALAERARQLSDTHGGHWSEHPTHTLRDWMEAVADDYTRLGYWEWVASIVFEEERFDG